MTAAGIRPVAPKREAPVGHHVAGRCSKTLKACSSWACPSPLFALPHDVVELARSRIDFGSYAAAS